MKKRYFAPFALVPAMIEWVLRRHEERQRNQTRVEPENMEGGEENGNG